MRLKLVLAMALLFSCFFAGAVMTKGHVVKTNGELLLHASTKKEVLDWFRGNGRIQNSYQHTTLKGAAGKEVLVVQVGLHFGRKGENIYMFSKVQDGWDFFMLRKAEDVMVSSVTLDKSRMNIIIKLDENRILVIQPMNSIG